MYRGKLVALLIIKLPRWALVYGLPALVGAALYFEGGYWWGWMPALIGFAVLRWSLVTDPYEGPIFRFPLATYLPSLRRQRQGRVERAPSERRG